MMRSWLVLGWIVGGLSQMTLGAERPNFVVVFIDDMGWGDFSCFGNQEAKTPNVDRLAAEGLRFTQFYVNSPICSPSRCALTTGQYPFRYRINSFLNNRQDNARRGVADWLDVKAPTLARTLQQNGYATGHFGKWHLGGQRDVDDAPPISQYGFDRSLTNFEGMGPKLLPLTLKPGETQPGRIWEDAVRLGEPVTWMQRSELTSGFVDATIEFIEASKKSDKSFYVNVWPDDVHSPYWPPVDQWREGKRPMYLAVLEALDRQLGKLFDHIRADPKLGRNTLLLVCSDNGPEPGGGSAGPFRGTKATLYEGGVRSPLIAWGPGLMASQAVGTRNETSVFAAFDLAPSLLSLAKVPFPEGVKFDGESLAPVLLGLSSDSRSSPIFWRRPPDRKTVSPTLPERLPDLAMREGKWKLLCAYDGSQPQLYDLLADLNESKNLASNEPQVVDRMTKMLVAWHKSLPADNGPALASDVDAPKEKGKKNKKAKAKL